MKSESRSGRSGWSIRSSLYHSFLLLSAKEWMPCWIPRLSNASNMRLFLVTWSARHWLSNRGHWGWLWIEVQSPNYSFIDLLGIICKFKAGNALHESIHMNSSAGNQNPWSLKILPRYFWGGMFQHQHPVFQKVFRPGYFEIEMSITLTRPDLSKSIAYFKFLFLNTVIKWTNVK